MTTYTNKSYELFDDDNDVSAPTTSRDAAAIDIVKSISLDACISEQLAELLENTATRIKEIAKSRVITEIDEEIDAGKENNEQVKKRKIPKRVSENIFLITFVWQAVCVLGLEGVDALIGETVEKKEKKYFIAGISVLAIFQLSNLILCLSVTIKLFKQYKHKHTSMKFLLHSYIATLFLFGGLYTFIFWIFPTAFDGLRYTTESKVRALELYSQLLFLSISTGTLCGVSGLTATHLASEAVMSFQMLLSFLYFTSILSEVINPTQVKEKTDQKS